VLALKFSITIKKGCIARTWGLKEKKKKHKRAAQGSKGTGGLDLRSGGGLGEEARPAVAKNKEGKKTKKKRANQQLSPGGDLPVFC
jgi:hypothetical protein